MESSSEEFVMAAVYAEQVECEDNTRLCGKTYYF